MPDAGRGGGAMAAADAARLGRPRARAPGAATVLAALMVSETPAGRPESAAAPRGEAEGRGRGVAGRRAAGAARAGGWAAPSPAAVRPSALRRAATGAGRDGPDGGEHDGEHGGAADGGGGQLWRAARDIASRPAGPPACATAGAGANLQGLNTAWRPLFESEPARSSCRRVASCRASSKPPAARLAASGFSAGAAVAPSGPFPAPAAVARRALPRAPGGLAWASGASGRPVRGWCSGRSSGLGLLVAARQAWGVF